jgi:hypothetical protein
MWRCWCASSPRCENAVVCLLLFFFTVYKSFHISCGHQFLAERNRILASTKRSTACAFH